MLRMIRSAARSARRRDTLDMLGISQADLCSHVLAIGGSGSGKTSVMKVLLVDVLRRYKNTGSIVAAVKPDEMDNWRNIAQLAGVSNRLVRLAPKTFTYNFLAWECSRPGGSPRTAAALLDDMNRLSRRSSGSGDEQFWANLFSKTCMYAVTIGWLARREKVNVENIYKLIVSSPNSFQQIKDPKFRASSFCFQMLHEAESNLRNEKEKRQLTQATEFFLMEAVQLGTKTRGAATSQVCAVLGRFLEGDLYDIVCCDKSSFSPEDPQRGKLVVVDFPTMIHGEGGRFLIALILKQVTTCSLARVNPRNVVLVVRDEMPETVGDPSEEVSNYALARSTMTSFWSGVQSVPTLQEALGGHQGEQAVHSIISNHATRLVLSTSCPVTAEMFSNAWGEFRDQFVSVSENKDYQENTLLDMLSNDRLLFSVSEHLVPRVPTDALLRLRRGSKTNNCLVDAYLSQAGRTYGRDASPVKLVTFKQI